MAELQPKHRDELINRIRSIDNKDVIDEIYRLLDVSIDDTVYRTSEEQKREIIQAQEQITNGKGISAKDADHEIDKWLEK